MVAEGYAWWCAFRGSAREDQGQISPGPISEQSSARAEAMFHLSQEGDWVSGTGSVSSKGQGSGQCLVHGSQSDPSHVA